MTAVVHPLPRNGWSNNQSDVNTMSAEDVSRMFVPRKSAQRSNSSSSIASSTSSTSTISHPSTQANGIVNGDSNWANRKKPGRGLWPASSKAEPVAGVSNARSQSVPANPTGSVAASATSALHPPSSPFPTSQQGNQAPIQLNGANRAQGNPDAQAVLNLQPLNGTFERKTIVVPFSPELLRIGRQTNQKTLPTSLNGYFDSKVLSRQHAEIWAERDGKIWIRDVKSSNGTFVNGKRLSQENRDSEPHPLKETDVLELGIDIVSEDQKTVVHHKVAARVDYAGLYSHTNDGAESTGGDIVSANGLGNQQMNQNGRGRPVNQGSNVSNGRFSGPGPAGTNMPAAAYHAKWLQPVSMEQIVRRLSNDLKQARGESSALQHASSYVGSVVASEMAIEANHGQIPVHPPMTFDNIRARFSPSSTVPSLSHTLSEGPSESSLLDKLTELPISFIPNILRSDTEKPKTSVSSPDNDNSPTKIEQSSQISSLVEALSAAQKGIATQGERLKELESELKREREERRNAEERAVKLEAGTSATDLAATERDAASNTPSDQVDRGTILDASTLQERIDLMRAEMDGMKTQMEKYRLRANTAEDASRHDRKTLAEMVESIGRREDAARRRAEKKRLSNAYAVNSEPSSTTSEEDREIEHLDEAIGQTIARTEVRLRDYSESDREGHIQNGSAGKPHLSIADLQQLGKAAIAAAISPQKNEQGLDGLGQAGKSESGSNAMTTRSTRRQEQLAQTAPYASMLGVVLLGVGLMAYLNGWQKVADR